MRLPTSDQEDAGINLTPIIDMVFLLLIFFLVATRFDEEEREVETRFLPEVAAAQPISQPPREVVVNVMRDGSFRVNRRTYSEAELRDLLMQAQANNPGSQSVLIRGHGQSYLQYAVRVMGLCNEARITNYRVAVVQEEG